MLPYKEYSKFKKKINRLNEKIAQKEDSLVYQNMKLLHANKIDEAIDYMENVLRKRGVSNQKIAMVNRTILELPGRKRVSATDKSVDNELMALASQPTGDNGFSFGDVAAKTKAKMDSVRAYEAEQRRLAQIQWEKEHRKEIAAKQREEKKQKRFRDKAKKDMLKIYTLLENNDIKKAYSKFQTLKPSLKKYSSEGEFKGLEIAVVQSYEAEKNRNRKEMKNRRKAEMVAQDIYSMLDQRNVRGAYSKFNNLKTLLKKYSSKDAFLNLQSTVNNAYESYKREMLREEKVKTKTEVARATPVAEPKRVKKAAPVTKPVQSARTTQVTKPKKTAKATKTVKTAKVAKVKKEEPVVVKKPEVTTGYRSGGYNDDPYAAFDKKQVEAQEKATQDVIDIYTLLENRQTRLAYEHFKKNQIPLKTYVSKEVYDVLESTVLQAYKGLTEVYE
jgi:hypothetical protein